MGDEIDLHGLTVDEAVPKLEEFIYRAFPIRALPGVGGTRERYGCFTHGNAAVFKQASAG